VRVSVEESLSYSSPEFLKIKFSRRPLNQFRWIWTLELSGSERSSLMWREFNDIGDGESESAVVFDLNRKWDSVRPVAQCIVTLLGESW